MGLCYSVDDEEEEEELPPIRLISFEKLQSFKEFPRFPNNANIVEHLDTIDRSESFIVFISHCWLAGADYTDQWRGYPHPDNLQNEKSQ